MKKIADIIDELIPDSQVKEALMLDQTADAENAYEYFDKYVMSWTSEGERQQDLWQEALREFPASGQQIEEWVRELTSQGYQPV